MVSVQQWAEIRRMRFVEGLAIREIRRRTGLHRETIRRALRGSIPPSYSRPARRSKLDPFKEELYGLLREDPGIESQRIREILIGLGILAANVLGALEGVGVDDRRHPDQDPFLAWAVAVAGLGVPCAAFRGGAVERSAAVVVDARFQ